MGVWISISSMLVYLCMDCWTNKYKFICIGCIYWSRLFANISIVICIFKSTFKCKSITTCSSSLGFSLWWNDLSKDCRFCLKENEKHFPTLLIICVICAILLFISAMIISSLHRKKNKNQNQKVNSLNTNEEEQQMEIDLRQNQND